MQALCRVLPHQSMQFIFHTIAHQEKCSCCYDIFVSLVQYWMILFMDANSSGFITFRMQLPKMLLSLICNHAASSRGETLTMGGSKSQCAGLSWAYLFLHAWGRHAFLSNDGCGSQMAGFFVVMDCGGWNYLRLLCLCVCAGMTLYSLRIYDGSMFCIDHADLWSCFWWAQVVASKCCQSD